MLSCNFGNYLIKRQSERYIIITIIITMIIISPYQRNTIQTLLFKLIRLELVEDSQTLSSSTNQSVKLKIDVNLSTSESLEAMFNILLQ